MQPHQDNTGPLSHVNGRSKRLLVVWTVCMVYNHGDVTPVMEMCSMSLEPYRYTVVKEEVVGHWTLCIDKASCMAEPVNTLE